MHEGKREKGQGVWVTDLVDHVRELSLGRVLAERSHDSSELLGGDGTISVWTRKEDKSEDEVSWRLRYVHVSRGFPEGTGEGPCWRGAVLSSAPPPIAPV